MATSKDKVRTPKKSTRKLSSADSNDLETQMPISEKDEVKKAEQRTGKNAKIIVNSTQALLLIWPVR
jgi:hypothetical protein